MHSNQNNEKDYANLQTIENTAISYEQSLSMNTNLKKY